MNKEQYRTVLEILETDSTLGKIDRFKSGNMDGIQLLLFDEDASSLKGLEEKIFGLYYIIPLADYNKLWVLDNNHIEELALKVSCLVNFDINILERLDKYYKGKNIEDKESFEGLLRYIKIQGYDADILTAVIERLGKPYDYESVKRTLGAFYKYVTNIPEIEDEDLYKDAIFTGFCNRCFEVGKHYNNQVVIQRQYDFIWCILAKAFLIKNDKSCTNKFDELLEFSLDILKCVMHQELYLMALYFNNNPDIGRVFAKLNKDYKKGIEYALENTAWDIFHSRMTLQHTSFYDAENNTIILPFFVTNDKGVYQYLNKCSFKAVVIENGTVTPVYKSVIEINKFVKNKRLLELINDEEESLKRKIEITQVDINEIKKNLLQELKIYI